MAKQNKTTKNLIEVINTAKDDIQFFYTRETDNISMDYRYLLNQPGQDTIHRLHDLAFQLKIIKELEGLTDNNAILEKLQMLLYQKSTSQGAISFIREHLRDSIKIILKERD